MRNADDLTVKRTMTTPNLAVAGTPVYPSGSVLYDTPTRTMYYSDSQEWLPLAGGGTVTMSGGTIPAGASTVIVDNRSGPVALALPHSAPNGRSLTLALLTKWGGTAAVSDPLGGTLLMDGRRSSVNMVYSPAHGFLVAGSGDDSFFATAQAGDKIVASGASGASNQGSGVGMDSLGLTLAVGAPFDSDQTGAVFVFTRAAGGLFTQRAKLVPSGVLGLVAQVGTSVSVSSDGSTVAAGGPQDGDGVGATWVWGPRDSPPGSPGAWQQEAKLVGTPGEGPDQNQGETAVLSSDGNTLVSGAPGDNSGVGAAHVFTRVDRAWSQQAKLVGTGGTPPSEQGTGLAVSADGNMLLSGGSGDGTNAGAFWIFSRDPAALTWTQLGQVTTQGFPGSAFFGDAASMSADGRVLAVGSPGDGSGGGAVYMYTWSEADGAYLPYQRLVGAGGVGTTCGQGGYLALSADGNVLAFTGHSDDSYRGALWVFSRDARGAYQQRGPKLRGEGEAGAGNFGIAVAMSADGSTVAVGADQDNQGSGATFVFQ